MKHINETVQISEGIVDKLKELGIKLIDILDKKLNGYLVDSDKEAYENELEKITLYTKVFYGKPFFNFTTTKSVKFYKKLVKKAPRTVRDAFSRDSWRNIFEPFRSKEYFCGTYNKPSSPTQFERDLLNNFSGEVYKTIDPAPYAHDKTAAYTVYKHKRLEIFLYVVRVTVDGTNAYFLFVPVTRQDKETADKIADAAYDAFDFVFGTDYTDTPDTADEEPYYEPIPEIDEGAVISKAIKYTLNKGAASLNKRLDTALDKLSVERNSGRYSNSYVDDTERNRRDEKREIFDQIFDTYCGKSSQIKYFYTNSRKDVQMQGLRAVSILDNFYLGSDYIDEIFKSFRRYSLTFRRFDKHDITPQETNNIVTSETNSKRIETFELEKVLGTDLRIRWDFYKERDLDEYFAVCNLRAKNVSESYLMVPLRTTLEKSDVKRILFRLNVQRDKHKA